MSATPEAQPSRALVIGTVSFYMVSGIIVRLSLCPASLGQLAPGGSGLLLGLSVRAETDPPSTLARPARHRWVRSTVYFASLEATRRR
jgi:hypothetical protein